ncbi:MAG: hypothetical protein MN733_20375 [Nitrososphaera sp.]|nr:hypothetical protein [Nitrososphaera sp.]
MLNKLVVIIAAGITAVIIAVAVSTWSAGLGLLQSQQTLQSSVGNNQASSTSEPSIEAEASEKEVWEELGLPYDPNEGEPTELTPEEIEQARLEQALEEELLRIDAKEGTTFSIIMEDERIKEEVEGARQVSISEFVPSENRVNTDMDKMTLTVTGKKDVEGSWETSQTSIFTGVFTLAIEVKDGTIMSIKKTPLPDQSTVHTLTEAEKVMIRTALQDSAVQAALKEKEDAGIATSISIRSEKLSNLAFNCPMNQCALIFIREVSSHATLAVWLNTEEGKVVKIEAVDGW